MEFFHPWKSLRRKRNKNQLSLKKKKRSRKIKDKEFCLESWKTYPVFTLWKGHPCNMKNESILTDFLPVFAAYSIQTAAHYATVEAWKHSSICVCRSFFSWLPFSSLQWNGSIKAFQRKHKRQQRHQRASWNVAEGPSSLGLAALRQQSHFVRKRVAEGHLVKRSCATLQELRGQPNLAASPVDYDQANAPLPKTSHWLIRCF